MMFKRLTSIATAAFTLGLGAEATAAPTERSVDLDLAAASKPMDRFFDLAVGADCPGTTGSAENLAQLKTAVDELGFRYLRFHDIFHDVYGTVKKDGDKLVFDFSGIDRLYDAMLARGIKPPHRAGLHAGRDEDVQRSNDITLVTLEPEKN